MSRAWHRQSWARFPLDLVLFSFLFCCFVFSLVLLTEQQRDPTRPTKENKEWEQSPPLPGQWLSTPPD